MINVASSPGFGVWGTDFSERINFARMRQERFAKAHLARDSYFAVQTEKDEQIFQELFSTYFHLLGSKHQVNFYQVLYEHSGS